VHVHARLLVLVPPNPYIHTYTCPSFLFLLQLRLSQMRAYAHPQLHTQTHTYIYKFRGCMGSPGCAYAQPHPHMHIQTYMYTCVVDVYAFAISRPGHAFHLPVSFFCRCAFRIRAYTNSHTRTNNQIWTYAHRVWFRVKPPCRRHCRARRPPPRVNSIGLNSGELRLGCTLKGALCA